MKNNKDILLLDLRPLQTGYAGKGIGRYTREMAPRLARRLEPRFRVGALAFAGPDDALPAGIPVRIRAPKVRRPWLWDQLALPLHLARHRIARFHSFVALGPVDAISYPVAWAGRSVLTVHDLHLYAPDAGPLERFYRRTWRIRLQALGLGRAARVICDSGAVAAEVRSRFGLPEARCRAVPAGCDHLERVQERPLPGELVGRPFVLTVGDAPTKNLGLVREAVERARADWPDLLWAAVGDRARIGACLDGAVPPWLVAIADPGDGVLLGLYRHAFALLFPSLREGFGIPPLEAARTGCPVLAADIPPLRETLGPEACLLPVTSGIPWARALAGWRWDPGARAGAAAAARARAAAFTWDAAADGAASAYAETA